MIYTVTFNPALDYSVSVRDLNAGTVNRTESESILPGGKGLNVSAVLSTLGVENTALGFIAGFTGDEIERRFNQNGEKSDFIRLKTGLSRINIKIKTDTETEINGSGPDIDGDSLELFFKKLHRLQNGDMLVLAGSVPKSLPASIYSDIMSLLSEKGILFVVDATGDLLINSLKYNPFLIKPNIYELSEIFGVRIEDGSEAVKYALKLRETGAKNVLVSMGRQGAVLAAENGRIFKCNAPSGRVINTVGAGDSMVAGFIAGWNERRDYSYALKLGVSSGSASAFSQTLADRDSIYNIFKEL